MSLDLSKIGGSDVAAILGINPWKTPIDVYMRIVNGEGMTEGSRAMQRGNDFEDAIAKDFRRELFERESIVVPDERNPASLSGEYWRATADDWFPSLGFGAEYKTAGRYTWRNFGDGSDEVPPQYYAQCAWYNIHFNASRWYLYSMHSVDDFKLHVIQRDAEVERGIITAVERFWNEHVVPRKPPEAPMRDVVIPDYSKNIEYLEGDAADAFRDYAHARAEIDRLETVVKEKAEELRGAFGHSGGVSVDGMRLKWSKYTSESTSWKSVATELNAPVEVIAKHTSPPRESVRYTFTKGKT